MKQRTSVFAESILFLAIISVVTIISVASVHADHNVDINTATVTELKTISGIGKVLAERIVEYRENERPFNTVDDLLNVKGIGNVTLDKIRNHVIIGVES